MLGMAPARVGAAIRYASALPASCKPLSSSNAALPIINTAKSRNQRCLAVRSLTSDSAARSVSRPDVVVTREAGKNEKLMRALGNYGISCLELPLIEHTEGPDLKRLPITLRDNTFDWIVITSPEAGLVFLDAWEVAGAPNVQIGVVGHGTASIFEKLGHPNSDMLKIDFLPSKATGRVLAAELPKLRDTVCTVLYPTSTKASDEIERGLSERGFQVTRLNTYSTLPIRELNQLAVGEAVLVPVVAVASPSAIRAWAGIISNLESWNGAVACIGETSASAAREAGLTNIYYPKNPGFEGWVESIIAALKSQGSLEKVLWLFYRFWCLFVGLGDYFTSLGACVKFMAILQDLEA